MTFSFTVCAVAEPGKLAVKTISLTPENKRSYDKVTYWCFRPENYDSCAALRVRLMNLMQLPYLMIVRGQPRDDLDLGKVHVRRWAGADKTLVSVDRAWLAIDLDGVAVPSPYGDADQLGQAAEYIRDRLLPGEFADVQMIACATASTGLVGSTTARLRLFVPLDRPIPDNRLALWAQALRAKTGLPVDPAIYQAGHPIYTGRPQFIDGAVDPVPIDQRVIFLDGLFDAVSLDLSVCDEMAGSLFAASHIACASGVPTTDWRAVMTLCVGGPDGFYEPLTRGLGIASQSGEPDHLIIGFVFGLLEERADPARRAQYGPEWVSAALRGFRRRDVERSHRIEAVRSRLFSSLSQNHLGG